MNREKGLAYCGLACCVCGENETCTGCRNVGCTNKEWCKHFNCCKKKGLNGCWECDEFPCGGMHEKVRILAFAEYIKRNGEEKMFDRLERNEKSGIVYHYDGQLIGDYDKCETVDDVIKMLEGQVLIRSKEIQMFYNDISDEFAKDWYENDSLLPVLKQFVSLLPPSSKILDMGCGAGYESMRLKKLGADVTGIDYSEEPIKIAKQKNPDSRFEVMDFRELSDELGCFDGIVAIASLIHISNGELELVFQNMKKVLHKSGFVLIAIVEGQGLSEERTFIERNGKQYKRYFYLHDKDSLNNAAISAGLRFYQTAPLPEEHAKHGWIGLVYQAEEHR